MFCGRLRSETAENMYVKEPMENRSQLTNFSLCTTLIVALRLAKFINVCSYFASLLFFIRVLFTLLRASVSTLPAFFYKRICFAQ